MKTISKLCKLLLYIVAISTVVKGQQNSPALILDDGTSTTQPGANGWKLIGTPSSTGNFKIQHFMNGGSATVYLDRFLIGPNGNIGIGVSDPDAKLQINGDLKFTTLINQNRTSNIEWLTSNYGNGFGHKIYNLDLLNGVTQLNIATRSNTLNWQDAIRITSFVANPSVISIGSYTPTTSYYKLHVDGNLYCNKIIRVANGIQLGNINDNNSNDKVISAYSNQNNYGIGFWVGGGHKFVFLNNGNLGIGTQQPTSKIHMLNASLRLEGLSGNGSFLAIDSLGNVFRAHNFHCFWNKDESKNLIYSLNEKIGINTSSADERLQINGNIKFGPGMNTPSINSIEWLTSNYGNGFGHKIYNTELNGSTQLNFARRHNTNAWQNTLTISSLGVIGINNDNPNDYWSLDVAGKIHSSDLIRSDNGIQIGDNQDGNSNDRNIIPIYGSTHGIGIWTGGSNNFVFLSNGTSYRMGIGNINPNYNLDISGDLNVNGIAYGSNGIWNSSDKRFKKNVRGINGALSKILQIQGKIYEFKVDEFQSRKFKEGEHLGFIADELEKILPEAIIYDKEGFKCVNYSMIIPILVEAIKEQQQKINSLELQLISSLENNIYSGVNSNASSNKRNESFLLQNYPNPFDNSTIIKYELIENYQIASIVLHDLAGKEVKNIKISPVKGKAEIVILSKELSPGRYYYSLLLDNAIIDTKHLIVTSN